MGCGIVGIGIRKKTRDAGFMGLCLCQRGGAAQKRDVDGRPWSSGFRIQDSGVLWCEAVCLQNNEITVQFQGLCVCIGMPQVSAGADLEVDSSDGIRQGALKSFYASCNTVEDHDPDFVPRFTEAFLTENHRVIEVCNL